MKHFVVLELVNANVSIYRTGLVVQIAEKFQALKQILVADLSQAGRVIVVAVRGGHAKQQFPDLESMHIGYRVGFDVHFDLVDIGWIQKRIDLLLFVAQTHFRIVGCPEVPFIC